MCIFGYVLNKKNFLKNQNIKTKFIKIKKVNFRKTKHIMK